jgi:adhesin transport system membrane fusion protein
MNFKERLANLGIYRKLPDATQGGRPTNQPTGISHSSHLILWITFIVFLIAIVWAYFAQIDEVTMAEGKVIPSQRAQVIQSLEGGIVKAINVHEGEMVKKGQQLMQIDDTQFLSSFDEEQTKALYLRAKIARLTAEINNQPFSPAADLVKAIPQQIETEKASLVARRNELDSMVKSLDLLHKELEMNRPLVKQGAVSQVDLLHIEQQINDINTKINDFKSSALNDLNQSQADLAHSQADLTGLKDRVTRTAIRSPVRGIVQQLDTNTLGGVIKPGMDIITIIPLDDTLLIEARVKPSDIGFLHPGQPATVKITAYDYSIYGGLPGKLEHISADTSQDEKYQSFYKILVRTNKNYLGPATHPLEIIPGMTASVDIKTGKRSVLYYIFRPVLRAREQAMRER